MGIYIDMSFDINKINITPEILSLISEIDEFKGSWSALSSLSPEVLTSLKKVATIESIGSSTRIEGNRLSDLEIEALLLNISVQKFETRDEQEVVGYSKLMEVIYSHAHSIPITENYIKQLHRDLLSFSIKDERHRGNYKTNQNNISAFDSNGKEVGIIFETATPFDTPYKMSELVGWLQVSLENKKLHPLLIIAIFKVVFLEIHPFQDGNGRLSRALTTLLLLKCGYGYVPYTSLESIIERTKERYYLCLQKTQKTIREDSPDWNTWILYFLRVLNMQKQVLEEKIKNENVLLSEMPKLSLEILDIAKQRGRVTVRDLVSHTNTNRNTIKKHIQKLVHLNKLRKHGKAKGTWYSIG